MRIIIEPTKPQETSLPADCKAPRVVIEHPDDDIGMEHVIQLVKSALVAYGFGEKLVNEYINDER